MLPMLLSSALAAATLPPGPAVSIIGPGASEADQVFGASVTIVVAQHPAAAAAEQQQPPPPQQQQRQGSSGSGGGGSGSSASGRGSGAATPPTWVRLDRPDGVAETGTGPDGDDSGRGWMTVADESVSFKGAVVFPVWIQPANGPFQLFFGGSADNATVQVVASGWSSNGPNATRLTQNSSTLTIHYSTACRRAQSVMGVESLGPGAVRLSVGNLPTDKLAASCPITQAAFYSYAPSPTDPSQFTYLYMLRVEADRNFSYVLQWAHPGIYYYGAAPSHHGRMMALTAGGEYNTVMGSHPMAIIVAAADGSYNNTLPAGFTGKIVHATPLRDGQDYSGFCLTLTKLTLFAGVAVNFPFCSPDPLVSIQKQMEFISVILPPWLHVFPTSNRSSAAYYVPTVNRTVTLADGSVMTTFRSNGGGGRWWIYNTHVTLSFTYAPAHAGQKVSAKFLMHNDLHDADGGTSPLFSSAELHCVPTPVVPLPSKFVTSITWATPEMLFEGSSPDGEFSFLGTYRKLGFNMVPDTGDGGRGQESGGMIDSPWAYSNNRTGAAWKGLKYGPELSGFTSSLYSRPPLYGKDVPNATLVAQMLAEQGHDPSSANIATEMRKWAAAQAFENATHRIDFAYDGVFYQKDVNVFCQTMRITKPDLVFVDDEGLGNYASWRLNVAKSENAQTRRWPGESDENLAYRMTDALLAQWSNCLSSKDDFPDGPPPIYFYGMGPAPDTIMYKHGFTGTPSPYGPIHHLTMYPDWLKTPKQSMVAGGKGRQYLPWITGGTYGEMDAVAVLDGTLHSFGVGATGFAFFSAADFDDGGKILAMSTATALAAPFEDYFFLGRPLGGLDVVASESQNILAWSGMSYQGRLWVVVTPKVRGALTTLTFAPAKGSSSIAQSACDLVTGKVVPLLSSRFSQALGGTIVLHIAVDAASGPGCSGPVATDLWWPE